MDWWDTHVQRHITTCEHTEAISMGQAFQEFVPVSSITSKQRYHRSQMRMVGVADHLEITNEEHCILLFQIYRFKE